MQLLPFAFSSLFIACEQKTDSNNDRLEPIPEEECQEEVAPERDNWDDHEEIAEHTANGLDFGMDLLPEIAEDGSNIFFSPFSISTALGMVYLGAKGETASEMESALVLSEDTNSWHQTQGDLINDLNQPERCDYNLIVNTW